MTTITLPAGADELAAENQWAVETHGLTKRFGENIAVNGVDLRVPRGCAFGYLGPNGAGKTTLIRTLLGLTHADAGTMSLLGHAVPRYRDKALASVGAIVDEPRSTDISPAGRTCGSSPRLANARLATESVLRSNGSVSCVAPMTRCRSTRWGCASASAWRPA
jgi:energy-coupling factor transporter ATP-binding protein EcfA2